MHVFRFRDRRTDRWTDHATRSVTVGRIYVRSTAMRPNNRCQALQIIAVSDVFILYVYFVFIICCIIVKW